MRFRIRGNDSDSDVSLPSPPKKKLSHDTPCEDENNIDYREVSLIKEEAKMLKIEVNAQKKEIAKIVEENKNLREELATIQNEKDRLEAKTKA